MDDLNLGLGALALILVGLWLAWRVARRLLRVVLLVGLVLGAIWLWRSGVVV